MPPLSMSLAALPVVEKQGIVWLHLDDGDDGDADEDLIPLIAGLEDPSVHVVDFSIDLPYGQPALVENVIDYAHIHVAHDGSRGGGHREMAAPIRFEILSEDARGFQASFASETASSRRQTDGLRRALLSFIGPTLVHYQSDFVDAGGTSGLALYCLPQSRNRSRLLYRFYSSFARPRDRRRPRFLEHLSQCRLLEEDMAVVIGQTERLEQGGGWERCWKPLDSSDALVLKVRRWLDEKGRAPRADAPESERPLDRFTSHTLQCSDCGRALRFGRRLRQNAELAALLFLFLAIPTRSYALSGLVLLALGLRQLAVLLERRLTQGLDAQMVKKPG